MESSFTLLKVRGIPIGVNWSWLLVFGLVVWSLASALFPATYPGFSGTTYLFMALVAAVLFFGSVLLHELGHALRALREGMPIRGITLWLFGGVAQLAGSPPGAGAEFRVAILGPVISAVIAAAFLGVAFVGDRLDWPGTVQGVIAYVGRINLLVLGFNLIPALPLDGGRVLRSWLWQRQQSFGAATRSAAIAGQAFGWMLVAIGIAGLFGGGTGLGGVWLALIGWFLISAARSEATQALIRRALGGVRVRDLMQPATPEAVTSGPAIEADQPAFDAVGAFSEARGRVAVTEDGRQVGVLTVEDVDQALQRGLAEGGDEREARRSGILVWLVVGTIILVAGGLLYRPPYVVVAPGGTMAVADGIEIDGVPVDELNGRYLLTSVTLSQRSALGTLWSALRGDREVLSLRDVFPPGVPADEYGRQQREIFRESRQVAAAAAAQAVGMPVSVSGSGARVIEVVEGSPAEGVLRPGDVVVEVEGEDVTTATELGDVIRSRPAGTELRLQIERDNRRESVTVTSEQLPDVANRPAIGVLLETRGLNVELPFEISFSEQDIGGPSAGLAYALAIADLLDDGDFAAGRTIAATGTISLDGDVGPVGGVEQKAAAADDAEADVFLVPKSEVAAATGEDVPIRGVARLSEALSFLRQSA